MTLNADLLRAENANALRQVLSFEPGAIEQLEEIARQIDNIDVQFRLQFELFMTGQFEQLPRLLEMYPLLEHQPKSNLADLRRMMPFVELDYKIEFLTCALKLANEQNRHREAAILLAIYLESRPNEVEVMRHLSLILQDSGSFDQGISMAADCATKAQNKTDLAFALYILLRGLLSAARPWKEISEIFVEYENLLAEIVHDKSIQSDAAGWTRLFSCLFWFPYVRDQPHKDRPLQQSVAQYAAHKLRAIHSEWFCRSSLAPSRPIGVKRRIGFLCHALSRHSVGWLSRWLIHYMDKEKFELFFYAPIAKNDALFQWFARQGQMRQPGMNAIAVANAMLEDGIDILIDMDSVTLDIAGEVLAMHPAPVMVGWLGWDASPLVDYFIADRYVLPDEADEYYSPKIHRMLTQVAVSGFEIGIPSLTRDDLGLNSSDVIMLTAQRGFKFHPNTLDAQMEILSRTPAHVKLAVKGLADQFHLQQRFESTARDHGVDPKRIFFLPMAATEEEHRANLAISDFVLDTYPYSGATTTIEALWAEVPVVTWVGKQYASRCSYSAIMNSVGLYSDMDDCVAFSGSHYVRKAIDLALNPDEVRSIKRLLAESKQRRAPLWNPQGFAKQFERFLEGV